MSLPSFEQRIAVLLWCLILFYCFSYAEKRFVLRSWSKERSRQLNTFWLPTAGILGAAILWYPEIQKAFHGWPWAPEVVGLAVWGAYLALRWRLTRARRAQEAPQRPFLERLREDVRTMPRGRLVWYILICVWALASIVGTTVMLLRG